MNDFIFTNEWLIRLFSFIPVLVLMALWEILSPRRPLKASKKIRWYSNLSLALISAVALRILLPMQAVGAALWAQHHGLGLLHHISLPEGVEIIIGILALDFVIYLQHAMFHFIPLFWQFHKVHHTDLDFDVTTAIRFHPIEILLSMGIKILAVILLGPAVLSVVLFEILLNATSMFNHGNVRLPVSIDRILRLFVVTPEMHRVHHSVLIKEYNSNFGFNLPWWDRMLGTYRAQPEAGHEGMTIGLAQFRNPETITLPHLLLLPFLKSPLRKN